MARALGNQTQIKAQAAMPKTRVLLLVKTTCSGRAKTSVTLIQFWTWRCSSWTRQEEALLLAVLALGNPPVTQASLRLFLC